MKNKFKSIYKLLILKKAFKGIKFKENSNSMKIFRGSEVFHYYIKLIKISALLKFQLNIKKSR